MTGRCPCGDRRRPEHAVLRLNGRRAGELDDIASRGEQTIDDRLLGDEEVAVEQEDGSLGKRLAMIRGNSRGAYSSREDGQFDRDQRRTSFSRRPLRRSSLHRKLDRLPHDPRDELARRCATAIARCPDDVREGPKGAREGRGKGSGWEGEVGRRGGTIGQAVVYGEEGQVGEIGRVIDGAQVLCAKADASGLMNEVALEQSERLLFLSRPPQCRHVVRVVGSLPVERLGRVEEERGAIIRLTVEERDGAIVDADAKLAESAAGASDGHVQE